jgi:hypothetical protein
MIRNIIKFLFPDDTKLKVECLTRIQKGENGKVVIHREFYTMRSYLVHYFCASFILPFRERKKRYIDTWSMREGFQHMNMRQIMQIGAIAFDAVASSSGDPTDPLSFSHTVTGSNVGLIVGLGTHNASITHTSVTYNSVSMTSEANIEFAAVNLRTSMWSLIAPATGANTVSCDLSGSSRVIAGAVSFSGADQTDLVEAAVTSTIDTNNTATQDITTITANSIVVDCVTSVISDGNLPTVGAGQTSRWNIKLASGNYHGVGSTEPTTSPATVTMSWTFAGTPRHALAAVAVKEAATSAIKTINGLARASAKTVSGLAIASVKTWNGLT